MVDIHRPRQPRGTREGGQWTSAERPQDIKMSSMELPEMSAGDSDLAHSPLGRTKILLKMLGRQRTIKYVNGEWVFRSPLSSSTYRKLRGEKLQMDITEAMDIGAIGVVDMLNRGCVDIEVIDRDGWPTLEKTLADLGLATIKGAYNFDHNNRGQMPYNTKELVDLLKGECSGHYTSILEMSAAKIRGIQIGYETGPDKDSLKQEQMLIRNIMDGLDRFSMYETRHQHGDKSLWDILHAEPLPYSGKSVLEQMVPVENEHGQKILAWPFQLNKSSCLLAFSALAMLDNDDPRLEGLMDVALAVARHTEEGTANGLLVEMVRLTLGPNYEAEPTKTHQRNMRCALEYVMNHPGHEFRSHMEKLIKTLAMSQIPPTLEKSVTRFHDLNVAIGELKDLLQERGRFKFDPNLRIGKTDTRYSLSLHKNGPMSRYSMSRSRYEYKDHHF